MSTGIPVDQVANGQIFIDLVLRNRFNQIILDRWCDFGFDDW